MMKIKRRIRGDTGQTQFLLRIKGANFPAKLELVAQLSGGVRALGKTYGVSHSTLSRVISGVRNTPKLIQIIEKEWNLSIEEIRFIYTEHKERLSAGNPVTKDEARTFFIEYRARPNIQTEDDQ